ncbi:hypothetical protein CK203_015735 [Vitis vinifera]|uniref:Uncharacterized protein n=1 Tax=Vitis vinifera TaxID=29760 RepID=A0A438J5E3_VITVI|nr:hypothetical protein CK203_015735 [Vitis vinifera]
MRLNVIFDSLQLGSFDTPDAYTGAYCPHQGIFLVVIGLYDSHIHDL